MGEKKKIQIEEIHKEIGVGIWMNSIFQPSQKYFQERS